MKFTEQQICDWKCFQELHRTGRYSPRSEDFRRRIGLSAAELDFVIRHYSALAVAATGEPPPPPF